MENKVKVLKKLLELQKSIKGLEIDTSGHGYMYLSGNKILSIVRPMMDNLGLLLIPEILDVEYEKITYETKNGTKEECMAKAKLKFTWYDSESGASLEQLWEQNAMNGWDKSIGSLLTYSERYFLMKTLHLSTDSDDLEKIARAGFENKSANTEDKAKLSLLASRKGVDIERIVKSYRKESVKDLTRNEVEDAINKLNKRS